MADGVRFYYFSAEQTASELPCLSLCFRWLKRRGISICKEIIDMADFRVQKTLGDAQVLHRPWWLLLWDAARGIEHDYTQGALSRSILLLAVPMVLEMAMESIFVVVDIFWVSHLGPDAVAVVGLTESMMVMVYTLAMGLSIGAAAVVARRIGEKDSEGAARAAMQSILLGLAISVSLSIFGALAAPWLLSQMGAPSSLIEESGLFSSVMLGGSFTAFMLFTINAANRGAGDAAMAMRVLWVANIINMILGPLCIFGIGPFPAMGVTGAAVATTLGRGIGAAYALYHLCYGKGRLQLANIPWRPEWDIIKRILRLSGHSTFQVLVGSLSWVLLVRMVAQFGSVAMAGYTIAIRLMMLIILPSYGLSNAAATLVGQSLGAGDPDRAEAAVWQSARYNLVFMGLAGVVFLVGAPLIVGVFTQDEAVASVAVYGLRCVALGFPFFAYGMVLTQSFNGAGDTATPTWINIGVFWILELPLAWLLSFHDGLQYKGVFMAITVCYSILAIVSALVFRRGKWRSHAV